MMEPFSPNWLATVPKRFVHEQNLIYSIYLNLFYIVLGSFLCGEGGNDIVG